MPADLPEQPAQLLKRLQRKIAELESKKIIPPELVSIVTQVSLLQCKAVEAVRFGAAGAAVLPQEILEKLPPPEVHLQGVFLLNQEDFPLDFALAERLVPAILDILDKSAPTLAALRQEVEQALNADASLLHMASKELLSRQSLAGRAPVAAEATPLAAWEKSHPDSPGFFTFVIRGAILPSLVMSAHLLSRHHDAAASWSHGHCPICGGLALMGRLLDDGGARMHVCSFCLFEYRVPRLGCPFCLASGEEGSSYYAADDEPGYLLDACSSCGKYIKLADFRALDRVWVPLLDDLGSLALDLYARQLNLTRPTLSAWGF
ncbi:MAG: formate dehydrogenase accessory protein FdhE [Desulfovibrionaceae bacterium]|nr:formate dehydrogenase accessory protein FdhE [Desulfovibrionaceae bacterium]